MVSQPDTGEQALEIADALTRSVRLMSLLWTPLQPLQKLKLKAKWVILHGIASPNASQAMRKLTATSKTATP